MDILPFLHIAVAGRVLFFFLAHREIGTTGNQDRGNTGVNGKAVVHVGGQFPGVGVKQAVDFLMVHGINALFLCLRDFKGIIHIMPVLRRGAAGLVVGKTVHFLCSAGRALVDGIIIVGCRRFLCRLLRGFVLRPGFLFRGRLRLWCCRGLIASRRIFLHGHTGGSGFLLNLGLNLRFIVLQALVEVRKFRRLRQLILALIEKRAALLGVVHQRPIIGRFLRRQGIAGRQPGLRLLFQPGQVAMLLHIGDKFRQKHFPLGLVCLPCLRPLMFQHMVFPAFILCVVFVIAPDMLDQGTVPVAKILPPLVVVRLPLKREVNAELGLVVPAPRIVWLLPFKAFGTVQRPENGFGFMQRHLLSVF